MKEYFKGFFVGCGQTIVGHPFDTIKTRIQANKKIDFLKLHRGLSFPLLTSSIINSIMFGSCNYFNQKQDQNIFISGFLSGLVISPIVTPIEKLKIDFQINSNIVVKDIKYTQLFKGLQATFVRESFASGIYFSTYNFCKKSEYIHDNTNNILFSGGIAGICSWLFTYPMDVIKTRIQSGETNTIYQSYIKGNLFRGLSVCLLRSFIVNSIGFFIYEQIN